LKTTTYNKIRVALQLASLVAFGLRFCPSRLQKQNLYCIRYRHNWTKAKSNDGVRYWRYFLKAYGDNVLCSCLNSQAVYESIRNGDAHPNFSEVWQSTFDKSFYNNALDGLVASLYMASTLASVGCCTTQEEWWYASLCGHPVPGFTRPWKHLNDVLNMLLTVRLVADKVAPLDGPL